jgi:hypothetical protein
LDPFFRDTNDPQDQTIVKVFNYNPMIDFSSIGCFHFRKANITVREKRLEILVLFQRRCKMEAILGGLPEKSI